MMNRRSELLLAFIAVSLWLVLTLYDASVGNWSGALASLALGVTFLYLSLRDWRRMESGD